MLEWEELLSLVTWSRNCAPSFRWLFCFTPLLLEPLLHPLPPRGHDPLYSNTDRVDNKSSWICEDLKTQDVDSGFAVFLFPTLTRMLSSSTPFAFEIAFSAIMDILYLGFKEEFHYIVALFGMFPLLTDRHCMRVE